MECKEVHKLLSPFIDNELGAHDAFAVAEHLELCASCQQEMEVLRRLDERLKIAGRAPIDDLGGIRTRILSTFSPWMWLWRWQGVGIAAAVVFFLFIGRQIFSASADRETVAFSEALISEVQLNINQPFSLPCLDPHSLQKILRQEGLVDIPNLAPAGFYLEGARISNLRGHLFVQLAYRGWNEEVSLFISKRWDRPFSGIVKRDGFTIAPLGVRAVFFVTKEPLENLADTHQLAEEEINALSS